MAVKTFGNERLVSTDVNTYLANSGLVYITSGTATSGNALSITNCFSASFRAYKIVITNFTATTAQGLETRLQVGTNVTSTGYYWNYVNGSYVTTSTYSQIGATNASSWSPLAVGAGSTEAGGSSFELFNPFLTTATTVLGARTDPRTNGSSGTFSGYQSSTTSFNGIYFSVAGTFTNLNVDIYGYRIP